MRKNRRPGSSASSQEYFAGINNPPASAAAWSRAGTYFPWESTLPENASFGALRIFHVRMGRPENPALLLIHGYPTSSMDFAGLAGELSDDYSLYALDTPGYGFSDKPRSGYKYSLFDDARLVDYFIREVARLPSLTLVTHDKGDSVGLALLAIYQAYGAARPYVITHHVITNGNVWLPLARLSWLQKALLSPAAGPFLSRILTPGLFAKGLAGSVYSPPLGATETTALASIFAYQDGTRIEHAIIGYLNERKAHEAEWLDVLARSDIPTALVWGEKDPIAPPAVADYVWSRALEKRIAPAAYWRIPAASHYVQHDQPRVLASLIRLTVAAGHEPPDVPGAVRIRGGGA